MSSSEEDRENGDPDWPLELSAETIEEMVDRTVERIVEHLGTLSEQPASQIEDGEGIESVLEKIEEPLPEESTPFPEIVDFLFDEAIPRSVHTAHPGFMAYIPGGGLFHSALADLVADATNRYVASWKTAPALARIEATVVEWFCQIVGYPEGAFGLLTTGGSMANLVATDVARRERLPEDFLDGVLYTGDQAHHSVAKTARVAGFPAANVATVPTDDRFRIRLDALREQIHRDRRAEGRRPFLVVANAGTTNTGAVDDLEALAELCDAEDLWLHTDAAYGGFFALTERGRDRLRGLHRSDSVTLDPHKGLFLPYGTGAVLFRDGSALGRTYATDAEYIPEPGDDAAVHFAELGPELSRDFRGLRVWLPLKRHGVEPFRAALDEKLDLAECAADRLRQIDDIDLVAEPQLSTLAFRVDAPGFAPDALDELNRDVLESVNRRGRVHLSATRLDGRFTLRISVLSFRTHAEHLDAGLLDLETAVREALELRR